MATIVLAEDHQIVREGLRALLQAASDLAVVAETGDGLEAVRLVEQHQPHVLVVDLSMPGLDGLEVTRQVKKRRPSTQVVILSMHGDEAHIVQAVRNGASAYVLKESSADDLVQAVRTVLKQQRFFSGSISEDQIEAYARAESGAVEDRYDTLTTREREVLQLVAEGYTSPEIAQKLFISPRTVDTHRGNLMAKLALHNQTELVRYAFSRGLISMNERPRGDADG